MVNFWRQTHLALVADKAPGEIKPDFGVGFGYEHNEMLEMIGFQN